MIRSIWIQVPTVCYAVALYFTNYVADALLGSPENHYHVDFQNWEVYLNGNVHVISLATLLLASAVFLGIGLARVRKKTKPDASA